MVKRRALMQELPAWLTVLKTHDPKLFEQVTNVQDVVMKDGALSLKTKTLMMMLGDAFLARPHGVKVLADRARAMGATEEEIAETAQVGYYMGGLSVLFPALNAFEPVQL
jgi:alkylhydroperoxidase/carboxymuconolactone decarboxylase family protein YurZ